LKLISGSELAREIQKNLREENTEAGIEPCLAIIIIGDNKEDLIYVGLKNKAVDAIGGQARLIHLAKNVEIEDLLETINKLNQDKEVDGILLQLPLPDMLEKHREEILSAIRPDKDVDGFCPSNRGKLSGESPGFVSCAALAAMEVIDRYHPSLIGQKALLVGDSFDLIIPLAVILIKRGCQVSISPDYEDHLMKGKNIAVIEKGAASIVKKKDIDGGTIVIDAGFYWESDRVCGNVDRDEVADHDGYLLPVPGGIGPLLIAKLMVNLSQAASTKASMKQGCEG